MTSYPMYLTTNDISDDLGINRQTAERWIRNGKIVGGVRSMRFWVVTGYNYIKFLNTRPDYRVKSKYYKTFVHYIRRKKDVRKTQKESGDDS